MPNHAIAAVTNAAVPVFSVGWMTGAKRGEWLDGMSLVTVPAAYALNGALYLAKRDWLLENRTFVTAETLGYVMPLERSVDIDTPLDWKWAEFLMEASDHG